MLTAWASAVDKFSASATSQPEHRCLAATPPWTGHSRPSDHTRGRRPGTGDLHVGEAGLLHHRIEPAASRSAPTSAKAPSSASFKRSHAGCGGSHFERRAVRLLQRDQAAGARRTARAAAAQGRRPCPRSAYGRSNACRQPAASKRRAADEFDIGGRTDACMREVLLPSMSSRPRVHRATRQLSRRVEDAGAAADVETAPARPGRHR